MEYDAHLVWEHFTPRHAYDEAEAFIIGYRVGRMRRHVYAAFRAAVERRAIEKWLGVAHHG